MAKMRKYTNRVKNMTAVSEFDKVQVMTEMVDAIDDLTNAVESITEEIQYWKNKERYQ